MERYEFRIDGTSVATLLRSSVIGKHWVGDDLPVGSVDSLGLVDLLLEQVKLRTNPVEQLRVAQVASRIAMAGSRRVLVSIDADAWSCLPCSMDATTSSD